MTDFIGQSNRYGFQVIGDVRSEDAFFFYKNLYNETVILDLFNLSAKFQLSYRDNPVV